MTLQRRLISTLLLSLAVGMPVARAQDAVQNSDLDSRMLYMLLIAEMSARSGDAGSAYELMLDAANRSRSGQLFERAIEIALRARSGDSALGAAQAWVKAVPDSKDASRYLIQILVGLNKLPETVDPIRREIANLPVQVRPAAISLLPRYFGRVADKNLAAQVLERALGAETSNPTTGPSAFAAIGTMRLLAADTAGALDAARQGSELNPLAPEPAQLALALMDPKLPAAEALVLQHLQAGGRNDMHMAYAYKLLEAQRFLEAKAIAVRINTTAPAFPEAWLVRGTLAHREKNNAEARTALTTLVGLKQAADDARGSASQDKGLTQAYMLLGDLAEQDKQWAEAERLYNLVDSPQEALRVVARRASLLARQGKLEEGRKLIRCAPEVQAEDARLKISTETQLLRDNKQFQAAYDVLKEAAQDNPGDPDYLYDLALAAEKLGRLDEMETLLRQVIAAKPDYHHAYNALGYSLAERSLRLDEARTLVRKALEFAPNDPYILDSLGWVEFRSGNLALALQILQGAYQVRQDPEIAAHLGEVLWNLRQQAEARAVWNAGLAQSPDNDTLNETIKRLGQP